jgi:hypothetical protein
VAVGDRMRRLTIALLFIAVAAGGLAGQSAQTAFNWAFVKRAADGSPVPMDFKERVAVAQGDLFKIYLQPVQNAFVYVFLHDAQGDLQLLFPEKFADFERATYLNTRYFIPEADNWFALDNARGTERFYLVASSERLRPLESLFLSYDKASAGAKSAARQAVLDEIARVRKEHSQLTIAAEKPVTIAGGTRGINAAIQKVATRIEAAGFYYKLFRLEH